MMPSPLTLIILSLLTIGPGRYAPHVQRQALPATQWAEQRAEWVQRAADVTGMPRGVLTAMVYYESTFRDSSRSSAGAAGPLQLLSGTPHHRAWMSVCAKEPAFCGAANVEQGALVLKAYKRRCGTMLRAITAYRAGTPGGRCMEPGPKAHATMALARQINWRLKHPSTRPLRAPRLP
jgi:soluble lytic murein transglycosylase-like protein